MFKAYALQNHADAWRLKEFQVIITMVLDLAGVTSGRNH